MLVLQAIQYDALTSLIGGVIKPAMPRAKILIFVGLFILAIVLVTLARASTYYASLVLEWIIVLAVFATFIGLLRLGIKNMSKSKLTLEVAESDLNTREQEVLERIAQGLSNKEIASDLNLAESTVKKHVSKLYSKLGAKRRTDAIRIAQELNLLVESEASEQQS
ncbi:response regulator transcription factor [Alteromonadaceae bacterium M269]|nr:response regulator transcription factor [Alteromonadaceae bacterium M269]